MNLKWNNRPGFTLLELLVVIGMIAVILGALTTSVTAAQNRARIQRATVEVRSVHQAILGYENFARGGKYDLPPMTDQDADASSLGFLLGKGGGADSGGKIPVLLQAALNGGGKMTDPWGTPYKVTIKKGGASVKIESANATLKTGFHLPNFYRLSEEERK